MASAAEGKRQAKKASASRQDSSRTLLWSILSAIGGAGLVFLGQVAIEEYRASKEEERETIQSQKQVEQRRAERADTFFGEYDELAERVDRAAEYVTTGRGGSRDDVLAVVRHFRSVIAGIYAERADPDEVARLYGGRLTFWSNELENIGHGRSPVANQFTDRQREAYLALADGLRSLLHSDIRSPPETVRRIAEGASPRVSVAAAAVHASPVQRIFDVTQPKSGPRVGGEEVATGLATAPDPEGRDAQPVSAENAGPRTLLDDAHKVVEAPEDSPDPGDM